MHGVYDGEVSHDGENLIVDGTKIKVRYSSIAWVCRKKTGRVDLVLASRPHFVALLFAHSLGELRW